jgi:hypothetical protein
MSLAGVYAASRPYRALTRTLAKQNKRKVGFGKKSSGDNEGGGRSEDPEDQETAVGGGHDPIRVYSNGNGSASVNSQDFVSTNGAFDPNAQPSANGHVNDAPGTPTAGEGAIPGQDTPNGQPRLVAASDASSQEKPGNGVPKPNSAPANQAQEGVFDAWHRERREQEDVQQDNQDAERNYRWASVDLPRDEVDADKLHRDTLWRLDRFRAERDAFGRNLPTPVDPPPTEES